MSKAQQTKAHIIEQAAELFNQKGYAGSSITDIMQATRFKKKEEFIIISKVRMNWL